MNLKYKCLAAILLRKEFIAVQNNKPALKLVFEFGLGQ